MSELLLLLVGLTAGALAASLVLQPRLRAGRTALLLLQAELTASRHERRELEEELTAAREGAPSDRPGMAAENAELRRRMDELADMILGGHGTGRDRPGGAGAE